MANVFRQLLFVCGFLTGAFLLAAGSASATTLTTSSFNVWKTSFITGSPTELNFYPINSVSYNTAAGITLSPNGSSLPFVFTGFNNGNYSLTGDGYSKALLGAPDAGAGIQITLPSGGENAFLIAVNGSPSRPATLLLSNGETYSITSTLFGATLSQPITWMRFSTLPGSQAYVNDFLFGTSALPQDTTGGPATPEPASLFLFLSGACLVLFGSRYYKRFV